MLNTYEKGISLMGREAEEGLATKAMSLAELAIKQIRESIIIGDFVPGQRLKEDELCRMYGISRPPIREAFKTLEANGLLVHKPRKGVFVAEFSAKDVEEVYTIIAMLYHKTTDIAMDIITEQDIATLKIHLDNMIKAVESSPYDVRAYQLAHGDFHQTIIDRAGNGRIRTLERELRDQVAIFSYTSFQIKDHMKASLDYHVKIYEAINERNKEKALMYMEEHVMKAIAFLVKQLAGEESGTIVSPPIK